MQWLYRRRAARIVYDRGIGCEISFENRMRSLSNGGVTCLGVSKTILIGIKTGRFQNRLSSLLRVGSHLVNRRRCKNLVPGWVNAGGAKKNKGGDVTGHCYYYYYYYYVHRVKEISYRFNVIFSFLSNSCLPLRVRPSIPRHSSSYFNIFYRGE